MILALSLVALLRTSDTDTTIAVERGQRLEVRAHAGEITVRTWARNAVRVRTDAGGSTRVDIDQTPGVLSVRTGGRHGAPAHVSYEITVPAWMAISLSGVNTAMDVDGVQGPITIETVEGDVSVKGGSGVISLRSVQGAVTLQGAKGRMDVNSVNSDVTVREASGDVQAQTVNGEVQLQRLESDNVDANTVNGDISYEGTIRPNGRYRLATHNGDVTVVVPDGADALVSVATFQGDFASDFPITLRERRGKRFEFTLGKGSARLELESFQGTIELRRPGARKSKARSEPDE